MRRSPRSWLGAIILLSIVLRLGVALILGDSVPSNTDETSYSALGARLTAGFGYSFDQGWYPFTPPDTPTAHWSFLYSAFIGGVYAVVGVHPLAVRIVQAIAGGALLPWLLYRLTSRLLLSVPASSAPGNSEQPPQAGDSQFPLLPLLSAFLGSVYLFFVLYAASILTETFFIASLLWSLERALALLGALRTRDATKVRTLALGLELGASLGVATLLRQSILPWVLVMALFLTWTAVRERRLREALAALIVTAAVMLACITPFTLRNLRVYGEFLLLNSNAGYAMFAAQHPSHGTDFQAFQAVPVPAELAGLNEVQLDRELMRRGLGFVFADPARYLRLSLSRLKDFFEFWPTAGTSLRNNAGRLLSFTLFLPLFVSGIGLAALGRPSTTRDSGLDRQGVGLLLLFMATYTLMHLLTWAMPRYRLPVDAAAMPFAALAVRSIVRRVALARRSTPLAGLAPR